MGGGLHMQVVIRGPAVCTQPLLHTLSAQNIHCILCKNTTDPVATWLHPDDDALYQAKNRIDAIHIFYAFLKSTKS